MKTLRETEDIACTCIRQLERVHLLERLGIKFNHYSNYLRDLWTDAFMLHNDKKVLPYY